MQLTTGLCVDTVATQNPVSVAACVTAGTWVKRSAVVS